MPSVPLTVIFWLASAAVALGQVMILRSTVRAWRVAGGPVPLIERVFAFAPSLVLALVLWLSYQSAVAPPVMEVEFPALMGTRL